MVAGARGESCGGERGGATKATFGCMYSWLTTVLLLFAAVLPPPIVVFVATPPVAVAFAGGLCCWSILTLCLARLESMGNVTRFVASYVVFICLLKRR